MADRGGRGRRRLSSNGFPDLQCALQQPGERRPGLTPRCRWIFARCLTDNGQQRPRTLQVRAYHSQRAGVEGGDVSSLGSGASYEEGEQRQHRSDCSSRRHAVPLKSARSKN